MLSSLPCQNTVISSVTEQFLIPACIYWLSCDHLLCTLSHGSVCPYSAS